MNATSDFEWDGEWRSRSVGVPSDSELLATIGRDLRSAYSDLLKQPIPDHLVSLVRCLEEHDDPDR